MYFIEGLISILLFIVVFLFGLKIKFFNLKNHRWLISFSAGVAIAYVFIHLLPELQKSKEILKPYAINYVPLLEQHLVYLFAMLGFMLAYGIQKIMIWSHEKLINTNNNIKNNLDNERHYVSFILHIIGYAIYVFLLGYLMIRNIDLSKSEIIYYTVALMFHFESLNFYFASEHYKLYIKYGRYILATAVFLGWLLGAMTAVHEVLIIILLGFISGAVIMSTILTEIPQGKFGKFWPFLGGSFFYASLLLIEVIL